jgi:phage tail-like protein
MKHLLYPVLASVLLASVPAFAMKNGTVKFFNDSKAFDKAVEELNLSSRFGLEIDGHPVDGVKSMQQVEVLAGEPEAYKDGEDGVTHTRPGQHKPCKISIDKDWSSTSEFYKWRKAVLDGKTERKSVSVIFHNDAGEEAGRISVSNCMPTKLSISFEMTQTKDSNSKADAVDLNSRSSGHASEKLELTCEDASVTLEKAALSQR